MQTVAVPATLLLLGVLSCVAVCPASPQSIAPFSNPDDGKIEDGVYVNRYFGLTYPLPAGWNEGLAGPEPSHSGYYVLGMLQPGNGERAMILITAHDTFFAAAAFRDGATMAREIGRTMAGIDGNLVDVPPSDVTIAGRPFSRIDYSGFGLYRSALITPIRCHLVAFNIMAATAELRAAAARSLDRLGRIETGAADPACEADKAPPEQALARVDPRASAPYAPPIPVRLIINAEGRVTHVHVIRATADQRTAITAALNQWRFRPPPLGNGVTALETGMLIQFTPAGAVNYLSGDRAPPG
jgi:hypothetical protein